MPLGKGTRPHENGVQRVYSGPDRRLVVKAVLVFGTFSPRTNLARPRLGSTRFRSSRTRPCRPHPRGGAPGENCPTPGGHPGPTRIWNQDRGGPAMEILHLCCAGLDVHKKSITACVRRIVG